MIFLEKNDNPKVSYIIPVKDESECLETTLRNLCIVSRGHSFEIIIVDDHSMQPVIELLDYDLLEKCKIFRNENRLGVAKSRAKGASKASGEFFIFLDAHVCFRKDILTQFLSSCKYYPHSIFGIPIFHETEFDRFKSYVYGDIGFQSQVIYGGWRLELGDKPETIPLPLKQHCSFPYRVPIVGAASMIISKELYFRIGGFDQDLVGYGNAEDAELCLRAWAFGCEVRMIRNTLVAHYISSDKLRLKELNITSPIHTQYDLAERNATRVMCLHLPSLHLEKYLSKDLCGFQINDESIENRMSFIEKNRVWSKEQVSRLATGSIFLNKISPSIANLKEYTLVYTDSEEKLSDLIYKLAETSFVVVLCGSLQLKLKLKERFSLLLCQCLIEDLKLESLDEIFHFYRGEVWDRGFKTKDQVLINHPNTINTRAEDTILQYLAPIWVVEDFILRYSSSSNVRLYLAVKDSILEEALRTSELLSKLLLN